MGSPPNGTIESISKGLTRLGIMWMNGWLLKTSLSMSGEGVRRLRLTLSTTCSKCSCLLLVNGVKCHLEAWFYAGYVCYRDAIFTLFLVPSLRNESPKRGIFGMQTISFLVILTLISCWHLSFNATLALNLKTASGCRLAVLHGKLARPFHL